MKQVQTFLSTYTADVSGVCSALFELGGMVVMHDPSGCNSTYNTHDEPRWYDMDSLVFISGLTEIEAIMGDDDKFINDLCQAAEQLSPAFIAIAGTPIPTIMGTDMKAIAEVVQQRTGIPSFALPTSGMFSYVSGAGMALEAYARRTLKVGAPVEKVKDSVNILGATPLDFSLNGCVQSMKKLLENNGFRVLSTWAMGSGPDDLAHSGQASVNLVVSSVGLKVAKALKEMYGTPYVVGTPCGREFNQSLMEALRTAAGTGKNLTVFPPLPNLASDTVMIGESVTARSLASSIYLRRHLPVRVICPLETEPGILSETDLCLPEEEDIIEALKGAKRVIADPLYRPVVPAGAEFYPLPHEAFSGRMYHASSADLVEEV